MKKTFYVTTPIYYPSGNPHIGHTYTTCACDTVARYMRFKGYDVMFSTGIDEYSKKISLKAEEMGETPKEYLDKIDAKFKKLWEYMNISYDRYVRTTDDYHVKSVQAIFKKLYDKGYIYKSNYTGKYCIPCESFWTDTQLVDGNCPDCGRGVVETSEEAYFLKLSMFTEQIKDFLLNTDYLRPESRVKEMYNNFIKDGVSDLCVSRTTHTWGIPVPFDEGHVIYVWIDALSNYITLLGYENDTYNDYEKYWPCDLHMMSNEIVRFHSIIWPIMLMMLEEPLPKKLYSHGWINFNGEKMSKSKGNVVDPFIIGERCGVDSIRYHILRDMTYGSDMNFTNENMLKRINADLSNDLGNLVSRTVAMAVKYFDGTLPEEQISDESLDNDLINLAKELPEKVDKLIETVHLSDALAEIFKVISRANKYIDETEPWILAKSEENLPRLANVLYNLLETIRISAVLLNPFMPTTMPEVLHQIGADNDEKLTNFESLGSFGVLPRNITVNKGNIIFPRLDIEKELEFLQLYGKPQSVTDSSDSYTEDEDLDKAGIITIDEFSAVKLRTGTIISAEKVKKSKKLLKLQINDGRKGRQILSGIAAWYEPENLVGKKIIFAANLKSAKLCGEDSEGMILAADVGETARVIFLDDDIPNGSVVR